MSQNHSIDVRQIREGLGLTQKEFAERYHFSLKTVQNWEQGIRAPDGPARTYLIVIKWAPEAVSEALKHIPQRR